MLGQQISVGVLPQWRSTPKSIVTGGMKKSPGDRKPVDRSNKNGGTMMYNGIFDGDMFWEYVKREYLMGRRSATSFGIHLVAQTGPTMGYIPKFHGRSTMGFLEISSSLRC